MYTIHTIDTSIVNKLLHTDRDSCFILVNWITYSFHDFNKDNYQFRLSRQWIIIDHKELILLLRNNNRWIKIQLPQNQCL